MRKIYTVGGDTHYANWMQGVDVYQMHLADLVVFTGGEDVGPSLYNKQRNPTTLSSSGRDYFEKHHFYQAKELHKPMIGICRGAQFLCVMSGGILVQNQDNPDFIHDIQLYDREPLRITSTHHQAQFPFNLPVEDYKILGWTENLCGYHQGESYEDEMNPPVECEIVHYPKTKCLGIQGHPEMMGECPTVNYLRKLLDKFLLNEL